MKKIVVLILFAALCASARAEVKQSAASASLVTTAASTSSVPVRGILKGVYFDIPTGKTGGVSIVSSEGNTLLSVSGVTADTLYQPRAAIHSTSGVAVYEATNAIYDAIAVVGDLTVTITPAANTTGTNNWSVKINSAD